eukprot:361389-Chlamydomonas_euryale.AAC.5
MLGILQGLSTDHHLQQGRATLFIDSRELASIRQLHADNAAQTGRMSDLQPAQPRCLFGGRHPPRPMHGLRGVRRHRRKPSCECAAAACAPAVHEACLRPLPAAWQ